MTIAPTSAQEGAKTRLDVDIRFPHLCIRVVPLSLIPSNMAHILRI